MAKNTDRPGVLIYHDIRPALAFLDYEQKGKLFDAILAYSEDGEYPSFDGALGALWCMVRPQIDRNNERYERANLQRKYAVYCREIKKESREPISFGEYCSSVDDLPISADINYNQTKPNQSKPNLSQKKEGTQIISESVKSSTFPQTFPHEREFEDKRSAALRMVEGG